MQQIETLQPARLLENELFGQGEANVFAILDGASVPNLPRLLHEFDPEHECLYRGDLEPDMREVAPYLVRLERGSGFTGRVLDRGWGKHWGVFALSNAGLADLRRQLRKFLIVHDGDGKPMYFRYYDPRVLRVYLPTCNVEELKTVFGPISCYLMEDEDPGSLLRFRFLGDRLVTDKEPLAKEN